MPRKKLIAANWKMYKTPSEAQAFMGWLLPQVHGHTRDEIVVCPPFTDLAVVIEAARDTNVSVGAQDCHWEKQGAFTGEVSAAMLADIGCTHVIIGHSERRQMFGDTDEIVNRKLKAALAAGLTPIVCVGELQEDRDGGHTEAVLERHCSNAFAGITPEQALKMTIAYEPVWAIGTGRTATPELAAEAHRLVRKRTVHAFGQAVADSLRILYGGSVKPDNAKALLSDPDIDGALVGGASLESASFAAIVKR